MEGCVLTRLRDFVDAVEKGSAFRGSEKAQRWRERKRGGERKGAEKREREEKEGTAWKARARLGSIVQYSSLGRTRAPENSSSRRGHESTLPSFASSPAELFDRGTVPPQNTYNNTYYQIERQILTVVVRSFVRSWWLFAERNFSILLSIFRLVVKDGG